MPSARSLACFLVDAQSAIRLRGQVTILLTSDAAMRRLNRQFRGKNKPTDVLSFPAADFTPLSRTGRPFGKHRAGSGASAPERVVGDLAISVQTARRQATERGHSLANEIKVLMLHGLLHLAGYDHETDNGDMARREQKLRAKLGLPHGLIERAEKGLRS